MGRLNASPLPPVDHVREEFLVRQDGRLVRRACHIAALNEEPAGYRGSHDGRLMVGVRYEGRTRRIAASRIAWAVHTGEWPKGIVLERNGDPADFRPDNLILTRAGAKPFTQSRGGGASSLEEKARADRALIEAMAEHPEVSIVRLSTLTGTSEPCVCHRLQRFSEMGLCHGPMCVPGRAWVLSEQGKALAASPQHIPDGLDTDILTVVASGPMRQLQLARRLGVASLTVKRRIARLIEAGMITTDSERRFLISGSGVTMLGGAPAPKVEPWLKTTSISAAAAKDVRERLESQSVDDRSRFERSRQGGMARQRAMETARRNGSERFNNYPELDRTG